MRNAKLSGQLFRLGAFPGTRRPQKNHGAVEFSDSRLFRRHEVVPLAAAAQTALPRKALVVAHDELCLQLLHCVHRYTDHDKERGTAKVELHTKSVQNPLRPTV